MSLTLESDRYPLSYLMTYVSDRIKNQFSTVAGVGDISLGGYRDPNLRIWVSRSQLNRHSLAVNDVINTIQNEHLESPAGQLESGKRSLNVRTLGEANTTREFENLVINQRGGQPNYSRTYLKQVARVEEGLADALSISRARGIPGVALNILKQRGSNAVEVAKAVRLKVAEIQKGLPAGMKLGINFDSSKYIEQAVSELNFTLLLSALLTAVAGAIPAALALGPGAESRMPMAIAVIGGVIFSTLLTLYVVPCFYSLMSRFENRHKHEKLLAEAARDERKRARL